MTNNIFITEETPSAHALRTFMKLGQQRTASNALGKGVTVHPSAVVLNCSIGAGRIGPNCVLVNVSAPSVDVEGCVLVQTTSLTPIVGKGGLLYNVVDDATSGELPCSKVRADVFMPGGVHHVMNSALDIDGGKAWKNTLEGNPHSFEGIYKANQTQDVSECVKQGAAAHAKARSNLVAP